MGGEERVTCLLVYPSEPLVVGGAIPSFLEML